MKSWEPVSKYNERPSLETVVSELKKVCDRVYEHAGNTNATVRIWVLRRTLEYLIEQKGDHDESER